ncbi:hypothetical protein DRO66_05560 [Candidatus Bathyarchaeota archaeon]|nr:MAG: hypothetical protein DRO66_05560 [Candidatus Bathyarchaeota archaeon]
MKLERIKKVRLLTSLKGTDIKGKSILWLKGTVFDKEVKPFPPSIHAEVGLMRIGVLEVVEYYPEPQSKPEAPPEEIQVVEEKPKAKPKAKSKTPKRRTQRKSR